MSFKLRSSSLLASGLILASNAATAQESPSGRIVVEEEVVGEARPDTLDLSFSTNPSGEHYGYLACSFGLWRQMVNSLTLGRGVNSGKCEVLVDGEVFGPYGGASQVRFSPDGARDFFVAAPNTRHLDETFMIVMDGTEGPLHEGVVGTLVLSADGKRIAFAADVDGARVFVDETRSPKWDYVWTDQPFFCGDPSRVVYAAKTHDGWAVVDDGVVRAETLSDDMGAVECLHDGTILYRCRRKKEHFVVVGSEVQGPYEEVRGIELSAEKKHYSYVAKLGKKREIVLVDGERSREFQEVVGTVTRAQRVAILTKQEKNLSVVLGERQSPEYDGIQLIDLSPDGEHVAVVGRRKKTTFLWYEGVESTQVTPVGYLTFSPDGRHLLTLLEEKDGVRVVIDGAKSEIIPTKEGGIGILPRWMDDSKAVAYARKDEKVVRRTFGLAP